MKNGFPKSKEPEQRPLPAIRPEKSAIAAFRDLSGREIIDRILEQPAPRNFVQRISEEDFYWLIKQLGEDDCLPLLELAHVRQWEYVLDLELWPGDRLDAGLALRWLGRLLEADTRRLVHWLFGEGEDLAAWSLSRCIQVAIRRDDDSPEIPEGFFTLDGLYYIRVPEGDHQKTIMSLLRCMAREDFIRYQALLLSLAGVMPAEMEEEMHRLRNVRLAEHGFLPRDEALAIYAPLEPQAIAPAAEGEVIELDPADGITAMVPVSPLLHADTESLFLQATAGVQDPGFQDRLQLEFAGLCNQLLVADGRVVEDLEVLIGASRKAAGYVNLGLEKVCGSDSARAAATLGRHSLLSVFRVGFALALRMRWRAERWMKGSWFRSQGLGFDFWGEQRGGVLRGLCQRHPRCFVGFEEAREYRDFERLAELEACGRVLESLQALDALLAALTRADGLTDVSGWPAQLAFQPLLFNHWARGRLGLAPLFGPLRLEEARTFLGLLRSADKGPPFRMKGFRQAFVAELGERAGTRSQREMKRLQSALGGVWKEFREEFEALALEDLDPRFSRCLWIQDPGRDR